MRIMEIVKNYKNENQEKRKVWNIKTNDKYENFKIIGFICFTCLPYFTYFGCWNLQACWVALATEPFSYLAAEVATSHIYMHTYFTYIDISCLLSHKYSSMYICIKSHMVMVMVMDSKHNHQLLSCLATQLLSCLAAQLLSCLATQLLIW